MFDSWRMQAARDVLLGAPALRRFGSIAKAIVALAAMTLLAACTSTETASTQARAFAATPLPASGKASTAQVYMFRGGFGDLFSSGINDMAVELRGKGVPAHALSWTNENAVLSKIERAYARNRRGPIILVGHSLGAGASVRIARSLTADGIPVDLVIVMDSLGAPRVPKGVRRFISYKASGDQNNPGDFKGASGFSGRIVNVDIRNLPNLEDAGHWSMVQRDALQQRIMREILAAYRRG